VDITERHGNGMAQQDLSFGSLVVRPLHHPQGKTDKARRRWRWRRFEEDREKKEPLHTHCAVHARFVFFAPLLTPSRQRGQGRLVVVFVVVADVVVLGLWLFHGG
jgi:hypothetical protein